MNELERNVGIVFGLQEKEPQTQTSLQLKHVKRCRLMEFYLDVFGLEHDAVSSLSDPTQDAVLLHDFRTAPHPTVSQSGTVHFLLHVSSFSLHVIF